MFTDKIQSPVAAVMRREWQRIARRKTLYMLMIGLPIVLFLLLALIYKNKVVQDIPIAVYDADNSQLSRLVVRSLDATRSLQATHTVQSIDEIRELMRSGKIQGAVYIPAGMSEKIKNGGSSEVVVYKNTANLIIGNLILKDGVTTIGTISAGITVKKMQAAGKTGSGALDLAAPIRVTTHSLYNPAYNYENFLVPGLLPVMLQMIILVVSVLVISSEYSENTIGELFKTAGYKTYAVIFGKALPHILVHTCTAIGMLGLVFPLFAIPVQSSFGILLLYMFLFICSSFFLGLAISCLLRDMMMSTEAAVFISTPAFVFSGFTYPVEAMPLLHRIYAQLLPSTHFVEGFVKFYQMGTPLGIALPQISILGFFIFVSLLISWSMLHFRLNPKHAERKRALRSIS